MIFCLNISLIFDNKTLLSSDRLTEMIFTKFLYKIIFRLDILICFDIETNINFLMTQEMKIKN